MGIIELVSDKALKGIRRRAALVEELCSGRSGLADVLSSAPALNDQQLASLLEAIEEISNKRLMPLEAGYLHFATPWIAAQSNALKREASRIVGNLAAAHPSQLQEAIPLLLGNAQHESTVVRWASAYALSRIVLLREYAQSVLFDQLTALCGQEQDNGVKGQYLKALRKAEKLRG